MAKKKSKKLWQRTWQPVSSDEDVIGIGGQGTVRKVENRETGQVGALKELININSSERRKRMQIEATSLRVLDHPQIAKLLDADTTSEGRPFIVTEFIGGLTLGARITEDVFCLADAIVFAKKCLDALHHAHSVGVFHRDIKPNNIILHDSTASMTFERHVNNYIAGIY